MPPLIHSCWPFISFYFQHIPFIFPLYSHDIPIWMSPFRTERQHSHQLPSCPMTPWWKMLVPLWCTRTEPLVETVPHKTWESWIFCGMGFCGNRSQNGRHGISDHLVNNGRAWEAFRSDGCFLGPDILPEVDSLQHPPAWFSPLFLDSRTIAWRIDCMVVSYWKTTLQCWFTWHWKTHHFDIFWGTRTTHSRIFRLSDFQWFFPWFFRFPRVFPWFSPGFPLVFPMDFPQDALDAVCQAAGRSIDQLIWQAPHDVARAVTLFGAGVVVLPLLGHLGAADFYDKP